MPPRNGWWCGHLAYRGRLRQSHGLVTVPLPDGIAFATKSTYRDTAYLAARIMPSQNRITTIAVNADLGRFEITRFDDAGSLLDGVEFATLVSASLDVVHPDVEVALTWPKDTAACASLSAVVMLSAERTLESLISIGRFMPAITSTRPGSMTDIARLDGVPPNMSVKMTTPAPLSARPPSPRRSR